MPVLLITCYSLLITYRLLLIADYLLCVLLITYYLPDDRGDAVPVDLGDEAGIHHQVEREHDCHAYVIDPLGSIHHRVPIEESKK